MSEHTPLLVRAKQAAAMCSVSPRTWATLAATGQIPESFKLAGCRVWRTEDLRLWIRWGMPNSDRFEAMRANMKGVKV